MITNLEYLNVVAERLETGGAQQLHSKAEGNSGQDHRGSLILEECRGAERLRGTPARTTWWEQVLGRLFPPGHPHHQPCQASTPAATSLEEQ